VHPYLFTVGHLTISSFSVVVALAILAPALLVCPPLMRRHGVPLSFLSVAMIATFVGGAVGARLWNVAEHLPFTLAQLRDGGFTWYGAVLGGFLAMLAVCLWRRVPPGLWFNIYVPAVALGYAIGRVACLLAGDGDYGKPSGLPWAMGFPHGIVPTPPGVEVHPTPVYESLVMLVVFVILYRMARRPQPGWMVGGWFLVLSGVERFLVEFLRINPPWLASLTEAQWVALATIAISLAIMAVIHRRPPACMPAGGGSTTAPLRRSRV
jgi:phosphatidylglycerol---prolipoprotein diacylglyceryl transferase